MDIPINANDRRISYTAVGGETSFDFDFPIFEDTGIEVIRTRAAVVTTLILTANYTVTVNINQESDPGGLITLTSAALAGDVYVLAGNTLIERTTDFQQRGGWAAAEINEEFDRIYMILQEMTALPAGTFANPLDISSGGTGGGTLVAARRNLQITANVKDFGAMGDGVADDAPAFQAALDYLDDNGRGTLIVPGTTAHYMLAQQIEVPAGINIVGDGAHVTVSSTPNTPDGGSWIKFNHSDYGFYFRDDALPGTAKKFGRIRGLGFLRTQPAPGGGWAPTAHSHDLRIEYEVDLEDVFFLNPTKAVYVRSGGMVNCHNVRGQPLSIGIEVERSPGTQNWNGIHWWPYWSQDSNVLGYTIANAYGFSIRRADCINAVSIMGIYYKRLFFFQDVTGDLSGATNIHLVNIFADGAGGLLELNSDFYAANMMIVNASNNADASSRGTGAGITIRGSVASTVDIINYRSSRSNAEALLVSEAAHQVRLKPNRIQSWDFLAVGSVYAIKADNSSVVTLLSEPELGAGSNIYSQANSGQIHFPVKFQLGKSAIAGTGYLSRRVTIADDTAVTISAPSTDLCVNMHLSPTGVPAAGNPAGSYWLRCSGSPAATTIAATTTTNVVVTTGVLTGTTGVDTNLTISAANDGNIYIENRTGVSRTFNVVLLGG